MQRRKIQANETLFSIGDPATGLYYVADGARADVTLENESAPGATTVLSNRDASTRPMNADLIGLPGPCPAGVAGDRGIHRSRADRGISDRPRAFVRFPDICLAAHIRALLPSLR